jgi:hypothetical protein
LISPRSEVHRALQSHGIFQSALKRYSHLVCVTNYGDSGLPTLRSSCAVKVKLLGRIASSPPWQERSCSFANLQPLTESPRASPYLIAQSVFDVAFHVVLSVTGTHPAANNDVLTKRTKTELPRSPLHILMHSNSGSRRLYLRLVRSTHRRSVTRTDLATGSLQALASHGKSEWTKVSLRPTGSLFAPKRFLSIR